MLAWSRAEPSRAAPRRAGTHAVDAPILFVSNRDRAVWVDGVCNVGGSARAWLEQHPSEYYQVRDLIGFDPDRYLWSRPLLGQQLLDAGLGIGLQPNQI